MYPHTGTLGISVLKSYRSKTVRKALLQAALIRRRLKIEGIHKNQYKNCFIMTLLLN